MEGGNWVGEGMESGTGKEEPKREGLESEWKLEISWRKEIFLRCARDLRCG